MKEHFLLQKKTVSRANADQPFFQKKSKEDSDLKASGNDHSSVSKVESFSAPLNFNSSPIQRKENKNLPEGLQTNMENSFGRDLSNVQIHKNSQKAVDLNARAFTQGDSVHFAPNEFNPNSNEGKELIGHEFTHVIQQAEGKVEPTIHENGVAINDDKSLEKEADQMGAKMSQSQVDLSQIQDSTSSSEPSTSSMTVQAKYENTQNK